MCGIVAVYSKKHKIQLSECNSALERMDARGPDFTVRKILHERRLFLGQTVLSITGSPQAGLEQYHCSRDERFNVILNGEIYNHRELYSSFLREGGFYSRTKSDTETLVNLHAVMHPVEVFKNLNGMFAYVVYDQSKNKLYIGRDVIGEKILYLYEDPDRLILSSEIGPILELAPSVRINKDVLRSYFYTRHLLTPVDTAFKGIRLVPPGHLLEYDLANNKLATLSVRSLSDFIDPDKIEENKSRRVEDLADELDTVCRATAKSLVPRDVDYFSVFSGGIDSSLASMFLLREKKPQDFICLQFPGKDSVSAELGRFEKRLGHPITAIQVDENCFSDALKSCYAAACSPLPTHSFVSQAIMSKYVNSQGAKVLIGGDGADEIYGGYESYKELREVSLTEVNPSVYSGYVPLRIRFKGWESGVLRDKVQERWSRMLDYYAFEQNLQERLIQTVLYSDTVIQLESVGIRAADTMSMINSVESRSFFLSQDLMRFALNLPARHKVDICAKNKLMITKPLLKRLYVRYFGKELLLPKQGFSGYPNEAGRHLLGDTDGAYPLVHEYLGIEGIPKRQHLQRALEWKLMNTELFLRNFSNYIH